jgi:hypothetical protein
MAGSGAESGSVSQRNGSVPKCHGYATLVTEYLAHCYDTDLLPEG